MTLTEFSQKPKGFTMAQYEKLLQEKKRLEKQIKKYSGLIDFESDALDILKDEAGSERHKKHIEQMALTINCPSNCGKRLQFCGYSL